MGFREFVRRYDEAHKKRWERLEEKKNALAKQRGFTNAAQMAHHGQLKKSGAYWCPTCNVNVRPQAPWGFTRIVTLSLAKPGKRECPMCKGTLFGKPRV